MEGQRPLQSMHEMLFRARVLGSKELNRGHVTWNNKNETFFVSLIPMESSACAGCVCQHKLRDKDHDFLRGEGQAVQQSMA